MGFYDVRCGVSGLSTRAARVRLILLRQEPAGLVPVALPVTGTYDRLGCIDNIQPSWNADLLLLGLQSLIHDGAITIHWETFSYRPQPLKTLEQVLSPIERGCTMDMTTVTCEGRPLRFMLVIERVYDAVVATVTGNRTARWAGVQDAALRTLPLGDLLERAFQGVAPAPALYELLGAATAAEETRARADLMRFIQFRTFLDQRHRWSYGANPGQHYDDDERAFVAEAKERFSLQPHLLAAVKASAAEFFAIGL
jgi:hypothetical protein